MKRAHRRKPVAPPRFAPIVHAGGSSLKAAEAHAAAPKALPRPAAFAPKCLDCGTGAKPGAETCKACGGSRLTQSASALGGPPRATGYQCLDCGTGAKPGAETCKACGGSRLGHPAPPRAPEAPKQVSRSVAVTSIEGDDPPRFRFGMSEVERVFGGGIVRGSAILFTGQPGIGKSTLLLMISAEVARANPSRECAALYVTGEEDERMVATRARRLGHSEPNLRVLKTNALDEVEAEIRLYRPQLCVIDSISTIAAADEGQAGSIRQIKIVLERLRELCMKLDTTLLVIVHVTKDGTAGGPKMLEHMVDVFVEFAGDRAGGFRSLTAAKNRFGGAGEVAIFEMTGKGLREVKDPGAEIMRERSTGAGSVIFPWAELARPALVEIETLVSGDRAVNAEGVSVTRPAHVGSMVGLGGGRVARMLAMMTANGVPLSGKDVDIEVRNPTHADVNESAADLAIAAAIASAAMDKRLPSDLVVLGEVSVTGQIRSVARCLGRLEAARAMGFTQALIPRANRLAGEVPEGVNVYTLEHLRDLARWVTDVSPERLAVIRERSVEGAV